MTVPASIPIGVPGPEAAAFSAETPTATPVHTATCVSPAAPIPRIFPTIICSALTEDRRTSTIREAFSSITPRITATP